MQDGIWKSRVHEQVPFNVFPVPVLCVNDGTPRCGVKSIPASPLSARCKAPTEPIPSSGNPIVSYQTNKTDATAVALHADSADDARVLASFEALRGGGANGNGGEVDVDALLEQLASDAETALQERLAAARCD